MVLPTQRHNFSFCTFSQYSSNARLVIHSITLLSRFFTFWRHYCRHLHLSLSVLSLLFSLPSRFGFHLSRALTDSFSRCQKSFLFLFYHFLCDSSFSFFFPVSIHFCFLCFLLVSFYSLVFLSFLRYSCAFLVPFSCLCLPLIGLLFPLFLSLSLLSPNLFVWLVLHSFSRRLLLLVFSIILSLSSFHIISTFSSPSESRRLSHPSRSLAPHVRLSGWSLLSLLTLLTLFVVFSQILFNLPLTQYLLFNLASLFQTPQTSASLHFFT